VPVSLEQAAGLSPRALRALTALEREVVDADGGRLKLEWPTLRARRGDRVEDLLWWERKRLRGFLGLYGFGSAVELAGMVAPDARRHGIGAALLDAAMRLCRARRPTPVLLIVPRASQAGRRLALSRGGTHAHSEHALVLSGAPARGVGGAEVSLRSATAADVPVVSRMLEAAFESPAPDVGERLHAPDECTFVIERSHSPVGTMRLTRDGRDAGVYGFAIDPSWQGRGLGREALRQACVKLRVQGAEQIGLEVEVENDRALALYISVGFEPVATEDYYALPVD
jgi:ribosomal protein S18 acetylase RimI-like enzyme